MGGVLVDQLYDDPHNVTTTTAQKLPDAMAMNVNESDGLMMFDIVHIINSDLWDTVRQGMIKSGYLPAE